MIAKFRWMLSIGLSSLHIAILDQVASAQSADTIYTGGAILTMAGPTPVYVEAVTVRDEKICFGGYQ